MSKSAKAHHGVIPAMRKSSPLMKKVYAKEMEVDKTDYMTLYFLKMLRSHLKGRSLALWQKTYL
jgi:hypothetical protein